MSRWRYRRGTAWESAPEGTCTCRETCASVIGVRVWRPLVGTADAAISANKSTESRTGAEVDLHFSGQSQTLSQAEAYAKRRE
jgi:hypothetical protein